LFRAKLRRLKGLRDFATSARSLRIEFSSTFNARARRRNEFSVNNFSAAANYLRAAGAAAALKF
jgi:hypothetical protein